MTNEQKNIEKQFNGLLMDLDLTDEQAENIAYLKRYVLEALRIHDGVGQSEQLPILDRCGCEEPNEEPIKVCMNCNGYVE